MLLTRDANLFDWDLDAHVNKVAIRRFGLGGAMVAIVAGVAGLSYWDARRESAAALQDFAQEQATLAGALGAAFRIRATTGSSMSEDDLLFGLRSIERPKALVIVARRSNGSTLRTTAGRDLAGPRLTEAFDRGDSVVRIPRDEAARFGLPARTALAGLSRIDAGTAGTWDIVAVGSNACDACEPGVDVEIHLRRDGGDVEIAVADSGMGISLADVGRALEPFFTTKAREGGTGLGLAIAHEIIASHRGSLVFSQRSPRDTRAAIRLPLVEEAAIG